MREQIIEVIEQLRPFLQRDGGDVEFVELTEDNVVLVRLHGHCIGCPHSDITIKNGIEAILKQEFPSIIAVEAV